MSLKRIGMGVILVLAMAAFAYAYIWGLPANSVFHASQASESMAAYTVPPLTKPYKNTKYGFELMLPGDFIVQEFPGEDGAGATLVFQNASGTGIQIVISPNASNSTAITQEDVHNSIPDLKIEDVQPIEIGSSYTGIAFTSNNDAFGGNSRDVWFPFKGTIYQITTYARLDPLLKAIFGTWKFI